MDIDLDLYDDKIKEFLLNRLEELKVTSQALEKSLIETQKFFTDECSNEQMDEDNVMLDANVWKKIFNNKFAIGLKIETDRSVEISNVIVQWNSSSMLDYRVHIFEQNNDQKFQQLKVSSNSLIEVQKFALVIITFDFPSFLDKTSYRLSGNIKVKQDDKNVMLSLPDVNVSSDDQINTKHFDWTITRDILANLLTIISCSEETRLLAVFPEGWNSDIDNTFEIDCHLLKVNVSDGLRTFYYCHKICQMFDNSLLAMGDVDENGGRFMSVFARNDCALFSFLHHIHTSVPGILIIPEAYSENYKLNNTQCSKESCKNLRDSLTKEATLYIQHIKEIISQSGDINEKRLNQFGSKLSKLEDRTDDYYVMVSHMNK